MRLDIPDNGKWWASRKKLAVEPDGRVEVWLTTEPRGIDDSQEDARVSLRGTPAMLIRIAHAIESQVASAEANSKPEVA